MMTVDEFWALDRRNKAKKARAEQLARLQAATGFTVPELVELLRDELLDLIRSEVARQEELTNKIGW